MSLISAAEDRLLDKYLDSVDCKCGPECIESWGDCCGGCPECARYEDDDRDFETEAEDRAERRAERW